VRDLVRLGEAAAAVQAEWGAQPRGFAALLEQAASRSQVDLDAVAGLLRLHPAVLADLRDGQLPATEVAPDALVRLAEALRLDLAALLALVRQDAGRYDPEDFAIGLDDGLRTLTEAWDPAHLVPPPPESPPTPPPSGARPAG
jgi:hypothetical protein